MAAALLAGVLLFASFPPRPLWFLAPVGIALLTAVDPGTSVISAAVPSGPTLMTTLTVGTDSGTARRRPGSSRPVGALSGARAKRHQRERALQRH